MVSSLVIFAKGKGFKIEAAGEEKVGDKPAAVVKVTGPDSKDFKLFFDKESGLPVKLVATVARIRRRDEFTQESTYERLQRLRRHQESHQARAEARRREIPVVGARRIQGPRQGRARHVFPAQIEAG